MTTVDDLDIQRVESALAKRPDSIVMRTERDADRVWYAVIVVGGDCGLGLVGSAETGDNEEGVWERDVPFGTHFSRRTAGAAFIAAAQDQQAVADLVARRLWVES